MNGIEDQNSYADKMPLKDKLALIPDKPGVYQFLDEEKKVIYIGKALNLRNRVRQYFHKSYASDSRIQAMITKIHDIELTVTNNEVEALILESNLIKRNKPKYNVLLKDDKSYPFIAITNEPYPRMLVTRRKIPGARYYGPYTDVKSMRSALKTVRDLFYIRSCNYDLSRETIEKNKYKLCLDYHIKKCLGPCENLITQKQYNLSINHASQILKGKIKDVIESLVKEMNILAEQSKYEDAASLRDRINALNVYSQKQKIIDTTEADKDIIALSLKDDMACYVIFKIREGKVIGTQHGYLMNIITSETTDAMEAVIEKYYDNQEDIPQEIYLSHEVEEHAILENWLSGKCENKVKIECPVKGDNAKLVNLAKTNAQFWLDEQELSKLKRKDIVPHSLKALQRDLRLSVIPHKIECFDISNIQGDDAVASMVVFIDGKPKKNEYRKYKIRSVTGPNDYASMKEVIERRYIRLNNEVEKSPDLIIVDGGKGQLSSATEVLVSLDKTEIPIIGLAKKLEEIFILSQSEPIILPRTSSSLRLLQQIRDEAHRFAVSYHRNIRSKRILKTELDLIEGIGKIRSKELLEAFGSVQGVRFASEEQLSEIVGHALARKIKEYYGLHDQM